MKETPLAFRFVRPILAMVIITASFGFLYLIAMRSVPGSNKDIVTLALGYILGQVSIVAGYYFGTSKDKSDTEQASRVPNTTTTQQTTVEEIKS